MSKQDETLPGIKVGAYQLDDVVAWGDRTGTVVHVIPANVGRGRDSLRAQCSAWVAGFGPVVPRFDGWQRDHECYAVLVERTGKRGQALRPYLYVPRVKHLRLIERPPKRTRRVTAEWCPHCRKQGETV